MAGAHGVFGKTYCKCRALHRAACSSSASCFCCPAGIIQHRQPGESTESLGALGNAWFLQPGPGTLFPYGHIRFLPESLARETRAAAGCLACVGRNCASTEDPWWPYPLLTLCLQSVSPMFPHLMAFVGCTTFPTELNTLGPPGGLSAGTRDWIGWAT